MTRTKRFVRLAGASLLCLVALTVIGIVVYGNETGTLAGVVHWTQMVLLLITTVLLVASGVSYLKQRTAGAS